MIFCNNLLFLVTTRSNYCLNLLFCSENHIYVILCIFYYFLCLFCIFCKVSNNIVHDKQKTVTVRISDHLQVSLSYYFLRVSYHLVCQAVQTLQFGEPLSLVVKPTNINIAAGYPLLASEPALVLDDNGYRNDTASLDDAH